MKSTLCCAAALAVALLLAGCGRTPQTTFYTLTPTDTRITAQPTGKRPTVAIASVTIPELIDRPQLVLPDSGARVLLMESHRWAEPLKSALPRILADNLSRLIGEDRVSYHPQYASTRAEYRLFVDLQQFEATRDSVVVDAICTIKAADDGTALTRRLRQTAPIAGEGYEALVAAYSRALGGLAEEIAKGVVSLPDNK